MLIVVLLRIIMLRIIMLNVVMFSVVVMSVIVLNVVAPLVGPPSSKNSQKFYQKLPGFHFAKHFSVTTNAKGW
jgi:hypothetical protein